MLRAWRDDTGMWWADVSFYSDEIVKALESPVKSLDLWPDWIRERLTILSLSEVGTTVPNMGKKISETHYWVYLP